MANRGHALANFSADAKPRLGGVPAEANPWADWLGLVASVGCAIHCAAMPFVVAFLPMLGMSFLADSLFHKVMVGVCTLLAVAAFIPGYRRHRRFWPMITAGAGLCLISVAAFALEGNCCAICASQQESAPSATTVSVIGDDPLEASCVDSACGCCDSTAENATSVSPVTESEVSPSLAFIPWITPLGGLLLILAHYTNRRFSCRCDCCPS